MTGEIAFVDTGLTSNIGQRLKAVQKQLEGEEMFLAKILMVFPMCRFRQLLNPSRRVGISHAL